MRSGSSAVPHLCGLRGELLRHLRCLHALRGHLPGGTGLLGEARHIARAFDSIGARGARR